MRAAVYNRFLSTAGGGERYAGMMAAVLAEQGLPTELVTHTPVDLAKLADHLSLDLSKVDLRVEPDLGDARLAEVSADYDLWVTHSYMSRLAPQAANSVYVVQFPTPFDHDLARWQRAMLQRVGTRLDGYRVRGPSIFTFGTGWFPPEGGRRRSWSWTTGEAHLQVPRGTEGQITFDLGRPGGPGPADLEVVTDAGDVLVRATAAPAEFRRLALTLPDRHRGLQLTFRSGTFTPGGGDDRTLGVAISRLRLAGERLTATDRLVGRFPWLLRAPHDLSFAGAYDLVVANSEYTRGWTRRLWGIDPEVLFPPVATTRVAPGAKANRLLSVGRFFGPNRGHSKKQLELVRAFADLHRRGLLSGWEYHLVGGCDALDQPYVEQVRAAAAGAPVHLHLNAPRRELEELLATSKVFWHATGLGEHEDLRPWGFEHFGITTVEAMAAGCVPVVIDKAGQREIVREGVDGYRFADLQQLQDRTLQVAGDEGLRGRLAEAAAERAQTFSEDAFRSRWVELVHRLISEAAPPGA